MLKQGKNKQYSYDMFLSGADTNLSEIKQFNEWLKFLKKTGRYVFELGRLREQKGEIEIIDSAKKTAKLINLASYDYLGYGSHPKVKYAAKSAIDKYGTGAASSPIIGGTFLIHKELENKLVEFMGFGKNYGAAVFATGYSTNVGVISAIMHPGSYVILDKESHASIIEGARLSGAAIRVFRHNDMKDLERVLASIQEENVRKLICCEGVYSAGGDKGNVSEVVRLAKKYNALTLVDEAHSIMIAGENGKGICEEQGVLSDVDMVVITFSKAFCSIGGALIARKELTDYINFYARPRVFSAAIPPSVAAGIMKVIELESQDEAHKRKNVLLDNVKYMRFLLKGKVNILNGDTWIIPVVYGNEQITMEVLKYLQANGVDAGCLFFPAVPRGLARLRLFISSMHTRKNLEYAARIIIKAAKKFNFHKNCSD